MSWFHWRNLPLYAATFAIALLGVLALISAVMKIAGIN